MTAPDESLANVKRFHQPKSLNRLIYSWSLRIPKGQRAYEYSFLLNRKGINTPEAIALIEERNLLKLLGYTYLITIQCDYPHTLYEIKDAREEEYKPLAKALSHYAAKMHLAQMMHKDFTPGNILWDKNDEGYLFTVVDINRMYFGNVSVHKGLNNMKRFWGPKLFTEILAEDYAKVRNASPQEAVNYILKKRSAFWKHFSKKHEVPFSLEY